MSTIALHRERALARTPILVTGAHRSGTTWAGAMLAVTPEVGYVREPFNLHHRPGLSRIPVRHWFTYVTRENAGAFVEPVRDVIAFRYGVWQELGALRSPRDAARMVRDATNALRYRLRGARALLKDPIAVFSAEWLAEQFDMDVVVLVRHPAAFAGSLARLGWSHPFAHFLAQPLLMRDHLAAFEDEIRAYAGEERPILDQAALLWRMIYSVVRTYVARHPGWIVVRHEDLSRDPVGQFRMLYERLDLSFTPDVAWAIESHTGPANPREAPRGASAWRLDSRANVEAWRRRVGPADAERIRAAVEDVSRTYYHDEDW